MRSIGHWQQSASAADFGLSIPAPSSSDCFYAFLPLCLCAMCSLIFPSFPPCGFQIRACLVRLLAGFLRMWSVQLHFLLRICAAMGSWSAALHWSMLLIFPGHPIQRIFAQTAVDKSLELIECWFSHSSCLWSIEEYFIFVLKTLSLMDFLISPVLRIRKASHVLSVLALTSASVPPYVSTMLHK